MLQKWNNIIINYTGGTMDVFLNGDLVSSTKNIIPYSTLDNLTIGEDNGIKGGICNVIYFNNDSHLNTISANKEKKNSYKNVGDFFGKITSVFDYYIISINLI